MSDFIYDVINKVNCSVRETEDDFIFTAVQPYCETVTEMKISKRVLIRALQCFMAEHNEEFKFLTKERNETENDKEPGAKTESGDISVKEIL